MKIKSLLGAVGALALVASAVPASAAGFILFGTPSSDTIPAPAVFPLGFDPVLPGQVVPGDQVLVYSKTSTGGLHYISENPVDITFEFLGKEAGYTNNIEVQSGGGDVLFDNNTAPGTIATRQYTASCSPAPCSSAELLGFLFKVTNTNEVADNGISFDSPGGGELSIAFLGPNRDAGTGLATTTLNTPYSVIYALFNDGGNTQDADYDDMVVRITIAEVPIPPAALLFGTALAGIGFMSRRKKAALTA